uniref:probable ATP-dependent RNA helicase DDX28 isoform X1 n=1 Tax=Osmia lignaria TaxID=473952 RepID=UPI0014790B29|nr:probable ATP-dependent RNA helicase DDX28 isoform X1 [Osmia lignaria]XP_034187707.1 probable ATP-dependent RNA helicase DDX28 isoform X1 [Osmia lignaria]
MLFPLSHLSRKNFDTLFKTFSSHHVKTLVRTAKTKRKTVEDKPEEGKKKGIPIITCKRPNFNFYKGDKYNKWKPVLASESWNHKGSRGDYFFIHPYDINNDNETDEETNVKQFEDFNLDLSLCKHIKTLNIEKPLEIQSLAIPPILHGHNTLIAAETGCGKTLAYVLPLITQVLRWKEMGQRDVNCPLGLIVTPSRELAVQIGLELIKISKCLGVNTKIITGGRTKKMMMDPPVGDVDILVCSFGVISKLTTVRIYNLKFVKFVVLDEADALLHVTFEDKLKVFLSRITIGYRQEESEDRLPNSAQLILASATIPRRLENVLGHIVNLKSLQHVTTKNLHKILVTQKFMRLGSSQKPMELLKYIKPKVSNKQPVIIFSNQTGTSYWLHIFLRECGIEATNLSGDMPLYVRQGKYGEFLNGKTRVLTTTNAGSRGLDTIMVNHILNYDFPLDTSVYVHRCGRTGRVGTRGECRVTNFISKPGEIAVVQKIERAVRKMKAIPIFNLVETDEKDEQVVEDQYIGENIENLDDVENVPY